MNKAITDGLVLNPPAFAQGLDVWSSGDGVPGSDTYDGAANAAFVPADQDFGGCLELLKSTSDVQKLRHMGQTQLLPGCYLQIKARVKAISGNLPSVRIAAWAGNGSGQNVGGVVQVAPSVQLQSYGDVVEVSAIVGTGARDGVDMAWGTEAVYGHFGLDLTGSTGGVVRIDDIEIEDITGAFLRDMLSVVDVTDFGAVGNGSTDDSQAFTDASQAANGRTVYVPEGVFFLGDDVTIDAPVRFEGRVTMPVDKRLTLRHRFDFPTYAEAFKDEVEAFKKAVQALMNSSDHEGLDLGGRRIQVDAPIDMQAAVDNKDVFQIRRVIRNGQFDAVNSSAWDTEVVTSAGTYSASNDRTLTNVVNVANIPVGSLVEGNGVGREIYVTDKNVGAGTVTLTQPLYGAPTTQTYTFRRFKYVLDFGGFQNLTRFVLCGIDFLCNGRASGVMIPQGGSIFTLQDCILNRPKDRGLTSAGVGCQGMILEHCQFLSPDGSQRVQDRTSVGFNANKNDVKVRNCRAQKWKHFGVLGGTGNLFIGNHWFQGDEEPDGLATGGIVFTSPNLKSAITGNYIDNNFIEWTNEWDPSPDWNNQFSFGGLTMTGNIFTCNDVFRDFTWLVIKPYGTGHFVHGLNVTANVFRSLTDTITRVEKVDDSIAPLDVGRMRNVVWQGNTYNGIAEQTISPVTVRYQQNSDAQNWNIPFSPYLPFGGRAKSCESVLPNGQIVKGSNVQVTDFPYISLNQGTNEDEIRLTWSEACRGEVIVTARVDNPL